MSVHGDVAACIRRAGHAVSEIVCVLPGEVLFVGPEGPRVALLRLNYGLAGGTTVHVAAGR